MSQVVLIVEDDPDIADIAAITLRREGYIVALAADGAQGSSMLAKLTPDLVLLDVAMPRKDGLQVLAEARRTPRLARTPIIMMTARNRASDVTTAMSMGATDYLVKPFEIDDLVRKVRARLAAPAPKGRSAADVVMI